MIIRYGISVLLLYLSLLLTLSWVEAKPCERFKPGRKLINDTLNGADVLVSATVTQIVVDSVDNVIQSVTLKLKRVFRGREYVAGRKQLTVFGASELECPQLLRLHATRVFALSATSDRFFLQPTIFPINIAVLDALHYFSYGLPHKKRRKAKQTICETSLCPIGSKCVQSTGVCECRASCRSSVGTGVCGSDSVSYASLCHLSIRSCLLAKKGQRLVAQHRGQCEKKNPCDDLRCGPGEDCLVSQKDGVLSADCVCSKSCPNYGDSVDSSPICSSDGVDYASLCHMKQHACSTKTNITARYFGKCDPCRGHQCPHGTTCHLGTLRKPECRCSEQCSMNLDPVCASDGQTYSNECVMKVSACKDDRTLTVYRKGKCDVHDVDGKKHFGAKGLASSPCSSLSCTHGSVCHINESGAASCDCGDGCPRVMTPVCATNGITFDNDCELKRAGCLKKNQIHLKHEGTCGGGVCASFTGCRLPQVCSVIDGQPECTCPDCGDELREVCGSDGRTYSNECKMRRAGCLAEKKLFVKHSGICEGCARLDCAFYSSCVSDGRGRGECRCPNDCPHNNKTNGKASPVCGTDGVTYSSECHLRRSACQQSKFIVVAFQGKCDACLHVECRYGEECRGGVCVCSYNCPSNPPASDRVCGENGVLYPSPCHLQLASCQKGAPIAEMPPAHCHSAVATFEVRYRCSPLNCGFGGRCSPSLHECLCSFPCAERDYPLCGSDGLTYSNQCHMNIVACRDQRDILVQPQLAACDPANDSCQCNRVGSYGPTCDGNGQCRCRPGVGGAKCDHCLPNFWGIHLIAQGALSCQPCGCSAFGSSRADCEQTTGRCECRRGAMGEKCNECSQDMLMTPSGCVKKEEYRTPGECSSLVCHHGATCVPAVGSLPDCQCREDCGIRNMGIAANMSVCGSDGVTYDNACQLKAFACRHQIDLVVVALGICDQEAELLPSVDRKERQEGEAVRLGSHCTLPSQCAELNAVCVTRPGRRGVCDCGSGSRRETDRCIDLAEDKDAEFINVTLSGRNGTMIDVKDVKLFMNITMTFTPLSSNGIILYAKGASGDDFVLRLDNRRIVVELGMDSVHSRDYIALHVNHTVTLSWRRKVVTLTTADGKVSARLDVENQPVTEFWIGGNGDGLSNSIVGTVVRLSINDNFVKKNMLLTQSQPTEKVLSHPFISPMSFNGNNFAEFPNFKADVRSIARVRLEVKPVSSDGLVMFWGTVKDGRAAGDFLALFLVASQPHFFWNLGSGIAYVKAAPIPSQRWSSVTFGRNLRNGSISVDGAVPIYHESMASSFQANNMHLDISGESLYLGGIPSIEILPPKMRKLNLTFEGHISSMSINDLFVDLRKAVLYGPQSTYRSTLCQKSFCKSSEACYERNNKAHCRGSDLPAISLNGQQEFGYLNSGNESLPAVNQSSFGFSFRTKRPDGVLWWESSWTERTDGDFLVVYLEAGKLKIGVNLGNDLQFKPVTVKGIIETNKWHSIRVVRKERRLEVFLDGSSSLTVVASPGSTQLDTDGAVYIGGRLAKKANIPVTGMFQGCIRELVINSNKVNLVHDTVSSDVPSLCT